MSEQTESVPEEYGDGRGEQQVVIKFLIQNNAAGSVIGKAGVTIADFQRSSQAKILLSRTRGGYRPEGDTRQAERILQVSGTLLQVLTALQLIMKKLEDDGLHVTPPDGEENSFVLKMVAPSHLCGAVIGKEGKSIQSFKEDSKCEIRVQSVDQMPPGVKDRIISIVGTLKNVLRAVGLVVNKMSEDQLYQAYYQKCISSDPGESSTITPPQMAPSIFSRLQTYLTIGIPDDDVGAILGRGGRSVVEIQQMADVRVKVSERDDIMPGTGNCRKVSIQGTFDSVMYAQQLMSNQIMKSSRGPVRGRGRGRGRGGGYSQPQMDELEDKVEQLDLE